nr:hypothetical protein Iba_scaffold1680762CG0010 [Ipomoea batatas]
MPPESGFLLGVDGFPLSMKFLIGLLNCRRRCARWVCPGPSNCYNEEQREVYRVEQPPERGIIDAAREWVSTRSRRISVVDEISHRIA